MEYWRDGKRNDPVFQHSNTPALHVVTLMSLAAVNLDLRELKPDERIPVGIYPHFFTISRTASGWSRTNWW